MMTVYVVCWIFLLTFQTYFCIQANSVDPDQTAPLGAVWSGSTLFAKMTFKITSRWQSRWKLLWLAVKGLNSDRLLKFNSYWQYLYCRTWAVLAACLYSWNSMLSMLGKKYSICLKIQLTIVISNSKGLSEILRDIRTSTYQICRI